MRLFSSPQIPRAAPARVGRFAKSPYKRLRVATCHIALCAAAILLFLSGSSAAHAQGLVWNAAPPGMTGWQVDAVDISPAPARTEMPASSAPTTRTYRVQEGDTLLDIAQKLGVDEPALAAANGLEQPDQLRLGQVLKVDGPAEAPAGPAGLDRLAGTPLAHVQFYPWPAEQGKTIMLWWRSAAPISLTLRLGGIEYPALSAGWQGWALLPVGALAEPGRQPLVLAGASLGAAPNPPAQGGPSARRAFSVTLQVPVVAGNYDRQDVPAETSDPILGDQAKVQAEARQVAALFGRESPFGWTPGSRFQLPLPEDGIHTSPFGTRRVYGSGSSVSYHAGEDFGVPPGTPVLAPAAGVVVLAEPLFVRGNAVILDHGHGVLTGYWHMQKLNVQAGDRVNAGDRLGEVGSTGLSTGPHLHWELQVHAVPVDPLQWLR